MVDIIYFLVYKERERAKNASIQNNNNRKNKPKDRNCVQSFTAASMTRQIKAFVKSYTLFDGEKTVSKLKHFIM